jgi:hypothetical protein
VVNPRLLGSIPHSWFGWSSRPTKPWAKAARGVEGRGKIVPEWCSFISLLAKVGFVFNPVTEFEGPDMGIINAFP